MNTQSVSENVIRKYLLGQTSEAERLNLEERLIEDDGTYEELSIVEDELTDEYLRGRLSQTERKDFETHFLLTPSRQEKLRFAKVVRGHLATHARSQTKVAESPRTSKSPLFGIPAFRNPVLSFGLAMALVLMVAGLAWFTWRISQGPIHRVTFTLTPGLVRSGDSENSIRIPRDANLVELQLALADETPYQSYNSVLETIDGRAISTAPVMARESVGGQPVVTSELPPRLIPPGEYRVKLNGVTAAKETVSLGSYYFKVLPP